MHNLNKFLNFLYFLIQIIKFKFTDIKKIYPNHKLNKNLVVSFTAKRSRFKFLHLMINSIFNQTVLPDEIILWIEKKDKKFLNKKILSYKKKGLKIFYCENLKSYNKIIHALKIRKKSYLISFDDDIIYDKKSIEFLVNKLKKNTKNIIANRVHKIVLNKDKIPLPYIKWIWNNTSNNTHRLNFQTGVFGVLYPPNCFHKDITKKNIFKKLSPYADDIWLYWMIRLNKKFIVWSGFNYKNYPIFNFEKETLIDLNISKSKNDEQIKNLINHYGFPK